MLPKNMRPKQVADFRPIANIRLFDKVFACLVLDRIEHQLHFQDPEEQRGFPPGKRIEGDVFTANVFMDKALDVGIPVWVVNLDLSKAFDRVHGPTLGKACLNKASQNAWFGWMVLKFYQWQFGKVAPLGHVEGKENKQI